MHPYTVSYNPEFHCIEVELRGDVDLSIAEEVRAEAIKLVKKHNCLSLLADLRKCTPGMSIFDILEQPQKFAEKAVEKDLHPHRFKRALVLGQETETPKFYETVALNRGHNVRLFCDLEGARRWLSEGGSKEHF